MPDENYLQDTTEFDIGAYLERRRMQAGFQHPLITKVGSMGAPASTQQALQDMLASGSAQQQQPAPKERGGFFGFLERNVGRPLGYVVTQVMPAWAELVTSPLADSYIKGHFGEETYNRYKQNQKIEGLSFSEEVKNEGWLSALNNGIRRLAGSRKERPGFFWGEKIIGEIVLDPTTYIGWGIASKIPILGKCGVGYVMDVLPTQIWRHTAGAGARALGRGVGGRVIPLLAKSNEAIVYGRAMEVENAANRLFGAAAINSDDPAVTKKFIQQFISWRTPDGPIPYEWVQEFEKATGLTITAEDVGVMADVFRQMDDIDYISKVTSEKFETFDNWINVAESKNRTPREFIKDLVTQTRLAQQGTLRGQYEAKLAQGFVRRTMAKTMWGIQTFNDTKIGRWAVNNPAKAMLFFGNYAPFNYVEDVARAMGAGSFAPTHQLSQGSFVVMTGGMSAPIEFRAVGELTGAGGSELANALQMLGGKVGKVPEFAGGTIPGVREAMQPLARFQITVAEMGSNVKRGVFIDVTLEHMEEAALKAFGETAEYKAMRQAIDAVPTLAKTKEMAHLPQMVRYLAARGEFDAVEQLDRIFTKGNLDIMKIQDVIQRDMPNVNFLVREEMSRTLQQEGLAAIPKLKQQLRASAWAKLETLHPQIHGIMFDAKLAHFEAQLAKGVRDPQAIADTWRDMIMHTQHAMASIDTITSGTVAAGATQGMRTGKVYDKFMAEEFAEMIGVIDKQLAKMDAMLDTSMAKLIDAPLEGRRHLEGVYGNYKKWLKMTRDEFQKTASNNADIVERYYPSAAKGSGPNKWAKEVDAIVGGNYTSLSKLPAKVREIMYRPRNLEFTEAARRGVEVPKFAGVDLRAAMEGKATITKADVFDCIRKAYHEEKSELFMKHAAKTTGSPRLTATGRLHYDRSNISKRLEQLFADLHMDAVPLPAVDDFSKLSKAARKKAKALEEQAEGSLKRRLEELQIQKSTVWQNIEHQIDTAVDGAEKVLRHGAAGDEAIYAARQYLKNVATEGRKFTANPLVANTLRKNADDAAEVGIRTIKEAFPNYNDQLVGDMLMRMINPFWIYQSRAWPWMLQQSIRHPGTAHMFGPDGRYWQLTDDGYIPEPLAGMQFSPIRGTVIGRLRRAFRGPMPLRFTGPMTGIEKGQQAMERLGFFPGVHVTLPVEMLGTITSEGTAVDIQSAMVESAPPMPSSALNAFVAVANAAGPEWLGNVANRMFPSKFREYYAAKVLYETHQVSLSQAKKLGHDDWIREATAAAAGYQLMEEQLSLTRINPEKWQKIREEKYKMVEEITGITPEEQEKYRLAGQSIGSVVPLSRLDRDKIKMLDGYEAMIEASRTLNEGIREEYSETMSDRYNMMEEMRQSMLQEQLSDDMRLQEGWMTPDQWRENYYDRWREYRATLDNLVISQYFGKLGRTPEEQDAVRKRLGYTEDIMSPVDLVIDTMFSMEPPMDVYGNKDWTSLFEAQEELLNLLPAEEQQLVRDYLNRNSTPLMKKFREGREYMRPYWNVEDELPKWYGKIGYEEEAKELQALFPLVRQQTLDIWKAINSGMPVDFARWQQKLPGSARLRRHIEEWRWHLAANPAHPLYDPRINDFLRTFYGQEIV